MGKKHQHRWTREHRGVWLCPCGLRKVQALWKDPITLKQCREQSTGVWTLGEAIDLRASIIQARTAGRQRAADGRLSVEDYVNRWLEAASAEGEVSDRSLRNYEWAAGYLIEHLGLVPVATLGREHGVDYRRWLVSLKLAASSKRHIWNVSKIILSEMPEEAGRPSPLAGVRGPKVSNVRGSVLADGEIRAVLAAASAIGLYARVYVQLLFETGARMGALARLRLEDVERRDGGGALLHLNVGGTGKTEAATRAIPVRQEMLALIDALIEDGQRRQTAAYRAGLILCNSKGGPITLPDCDALSLIVKKTCKATGVKWTSRDARRWFVTQLRSSGLDPVVARAVTGHTSDEMQRVYYRPTAQAHDALIRVIEGSALKGGSAT